MTDNDAYLLRLSTWERKQMPGLGRPVRFVQTDDNVRIACCTHGEGPPLVFVRGWISDLEQMWDDVEFRAYIEALADSFAVLRYDARGNGLSDREAPHGCIDD